MISMKKTAMAAAMAMTMGVGVAQAAPVTYNFVGLFQMYDASGNVNCNNYDCVTNQGGNNVTGTMTIDNVSGAGTANISTTETFFGYAWTAHDITLQATGPGQITANMLFDWSGNNNIGVEVQFAMDNMGNVTTLDGVSNDGIPGNPMAVGTPFAGFSAAFNGQATPAAVPVPAAAWLLGSGLLGLVGVARRKAAV